MLSDQIFASSYFGMCDVFALADRLAELDPRTRRKARFAVVPIGFRRRVLGFAGASIPCAPPPRRRLDVVIFLPAVGEPPTEPAPAHVAYARQAARSGALVGSVCMGAFHLAHAGLLDGREATTHWSYAQKLARRFPAIRVTASEMIVHHDNVVTAAGLCAYLDLALYLVARFRGAALARTCAQALLVDTVRRKQSLYGDLYRVTADDPEAPLAQLARWLDDHLAEPLSIRTLARRCAMSERTFLRKFKHAFAQSPRSYLQALRVERARNLLATSTHKWTEIVARVGFEDPSSFRRLFTKTVGASPRAVRARAQGLSRDL